jgi:hypothetical protein
VKGYLSRIAKQSGLRFLEPRVEPRALTDFSRSRDPIAPDVEQTVMVGPSFPEPKGTQGMQPAPGPERVDGARDDREDRAWKYATQAPAPREAHQHSPEKRAVPAAIENAGDATRLLPQEVPRVVREVGAPRFAGHPTSPRIVEQTTFKESGPSESAGERPRHADIVEPAERTEPGTKTSGNTGGLVTETKEYFARTAEILSNEEAITPELQTIVLREVQEWVGASPSVPAQAQSDPQVRDAVRVAKVAQARAPEVGTTRERERLDEPDQLQPIEQRFDLSIGTINVTIEEAERPRTPDPQTRQPAKAASDDESRFSRLSRSYL